MPRSSILRLAGATLLLLAGACDGQGQGDICDTTSDCQNGLVCSSPPSGVIGLRCCPQDQALATVAACGANQMVVGNPNPPDASADAGVEASADANAPDASGD